MRRIATTLTMIVAAVFAASLLHAPSATAGHFNQKCRVTEGINVCITVREQGKGLVAQTTAIPVMKGTAPFKGVGTHVRLDRFDGMSFGGRQHQASRNVVVQRGDQVQGRASYTLADGTRVTAATSGILTVTL